MTVATVHDLSEYRQRLAGLPAESFVGSLVWYSITGNVEYGSDKKRIQVPVRIMHDQLEAWFQELGLDTKFLPPTIKQVDAFRRASSAARSEWEIGDGKHGRLRVEEIDVQDEYVLRHVMRDITDSRGQIQVSAHVGSLQFFRGARTAAGKRPTAQKLNPSILHTLREVGLDGKETGRTFPLDRDDRRRVDTFIKDIEQKFTDMSATLHSDRIRAMIRDYVVSLNAIQCKQGGGVYFVHVSKQDVLDKLEALVHRIGQGCQFHQVPLVDNDYQRDMLTEAFQSEVEDECYNLLKEIAELNEKSKTTKKGKVSPARYATLKARYDEIVMRSEEYTQILGLAQGRSAAALEMALDGVIDMTERIG